MPAIRRVIAYSGLDFYRVLQLPADVYLLMLKNSVIEDKMATQEGRDYLALCDRLKRTEPDMAAVHKFNARKGGGLDGDA